MSEENREINELENMAIGSQENDMIRLLLVRYLDAIHEKGIECDIDTDEDGVFFLFAPIKGMERRTAFFTLTINEFDRTYTFAASYSSGLIKVPEVAETTLTDHTKPEVVAEFVGDFIWRCFSKEHKKYCGFEHINADSLGRYIRFLPDFFFEDKSKEYYAAGICLAEPDTIIPAGAAVYSKVGNQLIIDHVMIDENLRGIGLGTYLVNHIVSTAVENSKDKRK